METFFYPKSIVVIGVSTSPTNMGQNIVNNLVKAGYKGLIYSVGPKGGVIFGQSIYPCVEEIEHEIDLAVIFTPAKIVPQIMEECGRKGIRRLVIETGGFSEYLDERKDIEKKIMDIAEKWGIRFIGPNCIGIVNALNGVSVPFVNLGGEVPPGHIAILSQSGGVGISYLNFLRAENLGVSKFVSMGNKLSVNECDLLEYLIQDPETEEVIMYLEDIKDGRRLVELAKRSPKPILIHKANVGASAHRIAASHTAALTADDRVVSSAFRQAGIIRINRFQTAINYAKVLTLPPLVNNRIGIVSRSGGHAVIAADACDKYGFMLPSFSRSFLESIEKHFRASVIKLDNPLDLGDLFDLQLYVKIIDSMLKMSDVDGILLGHGYALGEHLPSRELIRQVGSLVKRYNKPVAVCVIAPDSELSYIKQNIKFPIFSSPEEAAESLYLSYMREWWSTIHDMPAQPGAVDKGDAGKLCMPSENADGWLTMEQGFRLLECYGIGTIPWYSVHNEQEAVEAAEKLGYPVVLKADMPALIHKTEANAVRLNIQDSDELRRNYRDMSNNLNKSDSISSIIQKMGSPAREIILGAKQDEQFGPIVLLGLGGILVEVFNDVTIRTAPITEQEAHDMVEELNARAILKGTRGQEPSDVDTLCVYLQALSHLIADLPAVRELDVNPLSLYGKGKGGAALDIRIRVNNGI